MTIQEVQTWTIIAKALASLGINLVEKLRGVFRAAGTPATDEDLDVIIRAVQLDARAREQLAKDDAAKARQLGQTDPPEPAA